jgi:hypothetical protein
VIAVPSFVSQYAVAPADCFGIVTFPRRIQLIDATAS